MIEVGSTVRILAYAGDKYNEKGTVQSIKDGKYWVSNMNMPWCGCISGWFTAEEIEYAG